MKDKLLWHYKADLYKGRGMGFVSRYMFKSEKFGNNCIAQTVFGHCSLCHKNSPLLKTTKKEAQRNADKISLLWDLDSDPLINTYEQLEILQQKPFVKKIQQEGFVCQHCGADHRTASGGNMSKLTLGNFIENKRQGKTFIASTSPVENYIDKKAKEACYPEDRIFTEINVEQISDNKVRMIATVEQVFAMGMKPVLGHRKYYVYTFDLKKKLIYIAAPLTIFNGQRVERNSKYAKFVTYNYMTSLNNGFENAYAQLPETIKSSFLRCLVDVLQFNNSQKAAIILSDDSLSTIYRRWTRMSLLFSLFNLSAENVIDNDAKINLLVDIHSRVNEFYFHDPSENAIDSNIKTRTSTDICHHLKNDRTVHVFEPWYKKLHHFIRFHDKKEIVAYLSKPYNLNMLIYMEHRSKWAKFDKKIFYNHYPFFANSSIFASELDKYCYDNTLKPGLVKNFEQKHLVHHKNFAIYKKIELLRTLAA